LIDGGHASLSNAGLRGGQGMSPAASVTRCRSHPVYIAENPAPFTSASVHRVPRHSPVWLDWCCPLPYGVSLPGCDLSVSSRCVHSRSCALSLRLSCASSRRSRARVSARSLASASAARCSSSRASQWRVSASRPCRSRARVPVRASLWASRSASARASPAAWDWASASAALPRSPSALPSLRADDPVDGYLRAQDQLAAIVPVCPEPVQRFDQWAMGFVVGLKYERCQNQRQHAPIVMSVGAVNQGLYPAAEGRSAALAFLDQCGQGGFSHQRKEDLAHHAVGIVERGLGDAEQQGGLAVDALQLADHLGDDALLGPDRKAMDNLDEEIH